MTAPVDSSARRTRFIALALAGITLVLYLRVGGFDFIRFDDGVYVQHNPQINQGVSWDGIILAFTEPHAHMWHPLTTLSHMVDCQLFGLRPGPHHLVNVLFHTASAVLLFFLLVRMTGRVPESAIVAALFAWHPLRVESVAWIAERKDVLCTLFWMLTFHAYVTYVKMPSRRTYVLLIATFALGIMTKPSIVTLPFVLVLLDIWPLRRLEVTSNVLATSKPLIREKAPLFAMAIFLSIVTYLAQRPAAVVSDDVLPFADRPLNAAVSYARYLGKLFWPTDLIIFYPHPGTWPLWQVAASIGVLVVVTLLVLRSFRKHPYLFVGWCWFLGTMVPMIGLVQAGSQSIADRYTYVTTIGILIAVVWGISAAVAVGKIPRVAAQGMAAVAMLSSLILSSNQLAHWKNTETLFAHVAKVSPNNPRASFLLGAAYIDEGRWPEALAQYQIAVQLSPANANAHFQLGRCLAAIGKTEDAANAYRAALNLRGDLAEAHVNLGTLLLAAGKSLEAIEHYRSAIASDPGNAEAHNNLGLAQFSLSAVNQAIESYLEALRLNPDYARAHANLGTAYLQSGKLDEAVKHLQRAVELSPDLVEARYNLAVALMKLGKPEAAMPHFQRAIELNPSLAPKPPGR